MHPYSRNKLLAKGFTIVELLVVIVIIGILAGLVVVSYGSWKKSIAEKEVRSELIAVSTAMNGQKNFGADGYPLTIPSTYTQGARVSVSLYERTGTTFCIDAYSVGQTNITLFVRQDGVVKKGTCAGGEIPDFYPNGVLAASQISAGLNNTCALSTGKIYCWGSNSNGQLGNGTTSATPSTKPIPVDMTGVLSGKTVTAITSGYAHNCALASGAVYCWGYNASGQLGDNSTTQRTTPVAVNTAGVLNGKTVTSISAGRNVTCAVATNLAYCWGEDLYGQLGNDATALTTPTTTPVAVNTSGVLSGRTVTQVDVGIEHVCAVASGAAYCWGANYDGRLGNGGTTQSNIPTTVEVKPGGLSGRTVTKIDAGHYNTCAMASGLPFCWGENDYGQLGNNTVPTDSTTPVAVSTSGVLSGKTISSVNFNTQDGCALADGQAFCWGRNSYGNVGDGTYNSYYVPVAVNTAGVLSGKTLTQIVVGANYACGLASGSVYCWGANNQGTLGDGTTTGRALPIKVGNP